MEMGIKIKVTCHDSSTPSIYTANLLAFFEGYYNETTWIHLISSEKGESRTFLKYIPHQVADWYRTKCKAEKADCIDLTDENIPHVIVAYNQLIPPEQRFAIPVIPGRPGSNGKIMPGCNPGMSNLIAL